MKTIRLVTILMLAVFVVGDVAAETPDDIHTFATQLKKDGMFEAAAAQFLRFARENPTDPRSPEALVSAGECLVESNNITNAVTVLESVASTYPDHASHCRVKVQLGRLYFELERYDEADRAFTDVVVSMPDCDLVPDALLGKGETLISTDDFQGGFDVLTSLIDNYIESPAAPRASYNRAYCLERLGRDDEALRAYERIVQRFPRDPIAGFSSLEAARINADRGNAERAIQYYARTKQFESKVFFVPASEEGAELLQSTGEHRQALAWLEELLARPDLDDPRSVHIRAVRAAFNAEDYESVRRPDSLRRGPGRHQAGGLRPRDGRRRPSRAVCAGDRVGPLGGPHSRPGAPGIGALARGSGRARPLRHHRGRQRGPVRGTPDHRGRELHGYARHDARPRRADGATGRGAAPVPGRDTQRRDRP
jgi:TolA-binding protein